MTLARLCSAVATYSPARVFPQFRIISLCLAASALLFPLSLQAADELPAPWPAGSVTITIPFQQGSETDTLYTLFKETFATLTGKSFVPRYVPGQAGADAWARMVDDTPDGSVLTAVNIPHIMLRTLQPDSGVSPANMVLCHITAYTPCVLWSAVPTAFDSVQSFVDAARSMNGGFLVAGPGRYSAGQIAARTLDRQAGVRTTYFPYTDSINAGKAVLNRQASLFWAHSTPLAMFGATVKPLAVAAAKRLPSMPNVPTLLELGFPVEEGVYYGVAVPLDTPEETQKSIAAFFSQHASTPAFQSRATALGFTPLDIPLESIPAFLARQEELLRVKIEDYNLASQE